MTGCPRTYCPGCDLELIHRDHRRGYESASALGQIIHRMKRTFTVGDLDLYNFKRTRRLLRLIEHKQTDMAAKVAQDEVLSLLDEIIAHYVNCPDVAGRPLHPESGVYLMRGPIEAATSGRRATQLAGPQLITNPRLGALIVADENGLYAWLDGERSPEVR